MSRYYYCYSNRLFHFLKAFDINYKNIGINPNTNTKFYVFDKSDKLDKAIVLYNKIKHSI